MVAQLGEAVDPGLNGRPPIGRHGTHISCTRPVYPTSKVAVNSLTPRYARRLAGTGIKVNAVYPGYTATEATNFTGPPTPEQTADISIRFAQLDEEGPTGVFVNDAGEMPW